jgi:hypothetical protein
MASGFGYIGCSGALVGLLLTLCRWHSVHPFDVFHDILSHLWPPVQSFCELHRFTKCQDVRERGNRDVIG